MVVEVGFARWMPRSRQRPPHTFQPGRLELFHQSGRLSHLESQKAHTCTTNTNPTQGSCILQRPKERERQGAITFREVNTEDDVSRRAKYRRTLDEHHFPRQRGHDRFPSFH